MASQNGNGNFFINLTKDGPQLPWAYIGIEGPQGSGKSFTAGMIALGLSVELHDRAPVVWSDTEGGANFLQPFFAAEKVDLLWKPTASLTVFRKSIKIAQEVGACALIPDSMTKYWRTTTRAYMEGHKLTTMQQMLPHWSACKEPWFDMLDELKEAGLHKIICGRGGFEWESVEVLNSDGEVTGTDMVKGDHKMKAEGETGHEPDVNIHMQAIKDPQAGSTLRQKLGKLVSLRQTAPRKLHIATFEKSRVQALNGKIIQWPDRDSYEPGDYRLVLDHFRPYLETLTIGKKLKPAEKNADSEQFRTYESNGGWLRRRQIAIEEWDAIIARMLPGTTNKEKILKALLLETICPQIRGSRTAFEHQSVDDLRFSVLVLNFVDIAVGGGEGLLEKTASAEKAGDAKRILSAIVESARESAGQEWQILKSQPPPQETKGAVDVRESELEQADIPF